MCLFVLPSEDRQHLLKLCDKLVKMECTREDILGEMEIDSTTESELTPVKPAPKKAKKAKMEAARDRAKMLMSESEI